MSCKREWSFYLCFHLLLASKLDLECDVMHEVVVDNGDVLSLVCLELIMPVMAHVRCVCEEDLVSEWVLMHGVKTGSTLELSPECPEISVRRDLASATWRGALHPCQVFVLDFGMWR